MVDQDLVGWIQINILPQSLTWLLGFGANHSQWYHIGTLILRPDKNKNSIPFNYLV